MLSSLIHTLQNNEQPSVPTGYLSMYHHRNVDHNIGWIPVNENKYLKGKCTSKVKCVEGKDMYVFTGNCTANLIRLLSDDTL